MSRVNPAGASVPYLEVEALSGQALPIEIHQTIHSCPKGSYQRGLMRGWFRWSGSDLAGSARAWSIKYSQSRDALIRRINEALPPLWRAEVLSTRWASEPIWIKRLVVSGPLGGGEAITYYIIG